MSRGRSLTGEATDRRSGWKVTALVSGITLSGAFLRLLTLNTRSFWLDETTAVRQASWSLPVLFARMSENVHPPLFHILLHYWIRVFGRAEIPVRAFPVTFGILAIPLAYWAGRTLFDRRVGLFTAAIVAWSPFFIWYSQEVRMYTLMLVFALLSTGALWNALSNRRLRWWALYALAISAGMMTHYFFAFLVLGQGLFVLAFRVMGRIRERTAEGGVQVSWRRPWRLVYDVPDGFAWLACLAVAAIPQIWWLPQVLAHPVLLTENLDQLHYGSTNPALAIHFNDLMLAFVEAVFGFHATPVMRMLSALWPLTLTAAFLMTGVARRVSERTWYLLVAGVGGIACLGLAAQFEPVYEVRYFTAVSVPVVVLIAAFLASLSPARLRPAVAAMLVVAAICYVDQSYNPDNIIKWDNRQAVHAVVQGYKDGDVILLSPYFASSVLEYYLPTAQYSAVRKIPLFDARGNTRSAPDQLFADLDRQVGLAQRVWVVSTWQDKPRIVSDMNNMGSWLSAHDFKLVEKQDFRQIGVRLYEARSPRRFFLLQGER